jgi:hypothetical protein
LRWNWRCMTSVASSATCSISFAVGLELDHPIAGDERAQDRHVHVVDDFGNVAADDLGAAVNLVAVIVAVVGLQRGSARSSRSSLRLRSSSCWRNARRSGDTSIKASAGSLAQSWSGASLYAFSFSSQTRR